MTPEFEARVSAVLDELQKAAPESGGAAVYLILNALLAAHAQGRETLWRLARHCLAFGGAECGASVEATSVQLRQTAPLKIEPKAH